MQRNKNKLSVDRIIAMICISVGTVALALTAVLVGFLLRDTPDNSRAAINSGDVDGQFPTISAGETHSLALVGNDKLFAWGGNSNGRLGLGDIDTRYTPHYVSAGGRKYKAIAAGGDHTLAIAQNGDLYSWGRNFYGQLGLGDATDRNTPVHVNNGSRKYKAIAASQHHSFAIAENGDLYAWGYNFNGRLGLGNETDRNIPVYVNNGSRKYKAISSKGSHSLAIAENGDLYAWGINTNGQLGLGNTSTGPFIPTYVSSGSRKYKAIAAGGNFSLAIAENGDLYAWGINTNGQLGLGNTSTGPFIPTYVSSGSRKYKAITAGISFSLAIAENGDLYSWGMNSAGQLGLGNTSTGPTTPTHVSSSSRKYRAIASGFIHSLAIAENGDLYVWGLNSTGQLGLGDITPRNIPTFVSFAKDITATITTPAADGGIRVLAQPVIAAGMVNSGLAIAGNGDLYSWGTNGSGNLGHGDTTQRNAPVYVSAGNRKYKAISVGGATLAIAENGDLYAMGGNTQGELGLGHTNTGPRIPTHVSDGNRKYKAVSSVSFRSFAIAENGDLYAWGQGTSGELGLGNMNNYTTPQHVNSGNRKYKAVSTAGQFSFAIAENGDLYSWGVGANGVLGLGTLANHNTPQHVNSGNRKFKAIATRSSHTLAIAENGDLYAWGPGGSGQLGLGTVAGHYSPQHVSDGGRKYKAIAVGDSHSLAIAENGDLYAWGLNTNGRLGLGHTSTGPTIPTYVGADNRKYQSIAAGREQSLAISTSGHLYSWGNGGAGRLGLGDTDDRYVPTLVSGFPPF